MQRGRVGDLRQGLDDAGARLLFHQPHQLHQGVAAHRAVGVEHHHVAVVAAPTAAEVGHIAGLAFDAALAPTVEQAPAAVGRLAEHRAQALPGLLLGRAQRRVGGVGQHEDVEQFQRAGGGQRLAGRAQTGKDGRNVFVADRHHDRGARTRVDRRVRCAQCRREAVAAAGGPGPHCRGGAADADPGEEQGHQRRRQPPQCVGLFRSGLDAQRRRAAGHRRHQHQQQRAAPLCGAMPRRRRQGAGPALAGPEREQEPAPETEPGRGGHGAAMQPWGRAGAGRGCCGHVFTRGRDAWDQVSERVREPLRRKARSSTGCAGSMRSKSSVIRQPGMAVLG